MTCSYDELYLPLAQRMMGDMFDFAVHSLGYKIEDFFDMFVVSGMAHHVESCNPTYVAGKNGCEVAKCVVQMCTDEAPDVEDLMYIEKSKEYWIGWILAYYQWISCHSFRSIVEHVSFDDLYCMYPTFHEADVTLFVEAVDKKYEQAQTLNALAKTLNCDMELFFKE